MEYLVLSGEFDCNGRRLEQGDYVVFEAPEHMDWTSISGGTMLVILRGQLEWQDDDPEGSSIFGSLPLHPPA